MLRFSWPGNVRELENAIEFGVAVCKGQTIHHEDLPAEVLREGALPRATPAKAPDPQPPSGVGAEAERLRAALEAHHWRRDRAARALGISRSTLWRRLRELHIG
jgi:transcriptional regulator of acetoin/glycerol metabolism